MDFTREPIIESIITAKDGHRIVVRSSKSVGHEEYFVDALEVISFGSSVFFRSSERPKPFLVPATDYEVLEVREPRVALKAPSIAGVVRIGPSKESNREPQAPRAPKEQRHQKEPVREPVVLDEHVEDEPPAAPALESEALEEAPPAVSQSERLQEKKKERRGRLRRRRGGRDEAQAPSAPSEEEAPKESAPAVVVPAPTLLAPPTTLIRDDIERLRKNDTFKGAFYMKDEQSEKGDGDDESPVMPQRLIVDEDEPGEEISPDSYKATPAKEVVRDFREPFWMPPRAESEPQQPPAQ